MIEKEKILLKKIQHPKYFLYIVSFILVVDLFFLSMMISPMMAFVFWLMLQLFLIPVGYSLYKNYSKLQKHKQLLVNQTEVAPKTVVMGCDCNEFDDWFQTKEESHFLGYEKNQWGARKIFRSAKNKWWTLLSWCLSIHSFYVGRNLRGFLYIFSLFGLFIWLVVDLILIVTNNFKDRNGYYIGKGLTIEEYEIWIKGVKEALVSEYGSETGMMIFNGEIPEVEKYCFEHGMMIYKSEISEDEYLEYYTLCPKCEGGTTDIIECINLESSYEHENQDGTPDKRYTNNPVTKLNVYYYKCKHCGEKFSKKSTEDEENRKRELKLQKAFEKKIETLPPDRQAAIAARVKKLGY